MSARNHARNLPFTLISFVVWRHPHRPSLRAYSRVGMAVTPPRPLPARPTHVLYGEPPGPATQEAAEAAARA